MNTVMVDGRQLELEADAPTAAEIAALAGLQPVEAHVLVRVDGGAATRVEPDAEIDLRGTVPELRSGRIAVPWTLELDGRRWDWIAPGILEGEVREIAGLGTERALYLAGADAPVRRGALIDLTGGTPQVTTLRPDPAPPARSVPVIVNGRPRELASADASFEDLVRLAFPQLPAMAGQTFTVTYRRGAAGKPDGSLVPSEATRLAPGAVINVSATTRS